MFINASDENIAVSDNWERAPLNLIEDISRYPVALIGDVLQRLGMMASAIRHVAGKPTFFGTVLPILTWEGDNLAIHRALDDAQPGDVLVINGNGETNRAVFGDLLGEVCLARNVAAVVIDGAVRDIEELDTMGLPVYARAVNPAGPSKHGPGHVGAPVACGNVVCNAGDAILGDRDGIIVISRHILPTLAEKLSIQDGIENTFRERVRATLR
ncbi:RraA family protein [Pseudomonas sp. GD03842]|uniref:RraA family protein n=1 Tax=unclassified Pseudomonas TaxID=196821 RepID=UPI000D34E677|nr:MULTISPECIES: RraA family protein [unclassified Pseudomonas]MDH0746855.1 RraA family protein [Pseudomonas sp. GD03842]RAU43897.1 RraA family protein [Pseudomonas sp. RIT 409]RAU56209.1 RraA family protein [Pseudomonas sp. RIT 412]